MRDEHLECDGQWDTSEEWDPRAVNEEEEWYAQQDKQYDAKKESEEFWEKFQESVRKVV